MAKQLAKEAAHRMRRYGTSLAEIATHLHVSKSTVSTWCRDIPLSLVATERIVSRAHKSSTKGILAYTESLRQMREMRMTEDAELGQRRVGEFSKRDLYFIGLGLYWGEGYKRGNQEFGFTNSDPEMIKLYIQWLRVSFGISHDSLILRVSINKIHSSRVDYVETFWSKVTNVPRLQFTRISLIQSASKKEYTNYSDYFGTLRIKVRRGAHLRREILGAITAVSRSDLKI